MDSQKHILLTVSLALLFNQSSSHTTSAATGHLHEKKNEQLTMAKLGRDQCAEVDSVGKTHQYLTKLNVFFFRQMTMIKTV